MNPYVIIGIGIAWVLSLAAVGAWQRSDGKTVERTAWVERESKINAESAQRISELAADLLNAQQLGQQKLAAADEKYLKEIADVEKQRDAAIADVRAGKRKLFVNAKCPSGGGAEGQTAAAAGSGDATVRAELSAEDGAFFIGEAARADKVVKTLHLCQATVRTYQETCR